MYVLILKANMMHYFSNFYYMGRTYCIFWNTFTILTVLYSIEFYLQHVLQFNDSVHIYTSNFTHF